MHSIARQKLENKALQTTHAECRPNIWKRYVDVIKKDQVKNFTDHLNSIDNTNSIKFTNEEETNGVIPFLHLLINRQPDKTVKIQIYRKPTHRPTDQYLHFQPHRLIHHKSGVVRNLMDRKDTLVSTEDGIRIEKSYTCIEELRLSKVDVRQSKARPMSEKEKDNNRHKEKKQVRQ